MSKSDNDFSLVDQESEQLDLLSSNEMPDGLFADEESDQGPEKYYLRHYTGARLFAQKPETYKYIIFLLAEQVSLRRIARLNKVSVNTVRAVRDREGSIVDTLKERLSQNCRDVAMLGADSLLDDFSDPEAVKKISAKDKAVIVGIMIEKSELLQGMPTSIQGTHKPEPTADDFNEYLEGLPVADVEVHESMGPAGEAQNKKALPDSGESLDTVSDVNVQIPEVIGASAAGDNETDNESDQLNTQKALGANKEGAPGNKDTSAPGARITEGAGGVEPAADSIG